MYKNILHEVEDPTIDHQEKNQHVVKHTPIKYLKKAKACPFLKWAGGKRALVPEIVKLLPKSFHTYYEPFVGGGAVFFALDSRINKAVLSDVNEDLMLTYRVIQTTPEDLIKHLHAHKRKHCRKYYSSVRGQDDVSDDLVKLAARFIYLNKTCFNGLYRVNKAGKFNVPMGGYENPCICDEDNIRAVGKVLEKAVVHKQSFNKIAPGKGDLVYCDPPYDECFTQYTADGFGAKTQQELRQACDKWRDAGAHVIVSNSDTDLIRKTYKGYKFVEVNGVRNISCKGSGRGKIKELLIVGGDNGK